MIINIIDCYYISNVTLGEFDAIFGTFDYIYKLTSFNDNIFHNEFQK